MDGRAPGAHPGLASSAADDYLDETGAGEVPGARRKGCAMAKSRPQSDSLSFSARTQALARKSAFKNQTYSIRTDQISKLRRFAYERETKVSAVVREAIDRYLEEEGGHGATR